MQEEAILPFGLNKTKRYVSEGGERQLFVSHRVGESGSVELVDYMGGDATVERVATAGHGRGIFREQPTQEDFLRYLIANGIYEPFKSVHVKASIQSPILAALAFVYDGRVNTNEHSGRYSEMIRSFLVPSVEQIASLLSGEIGGVARNERAGNIRDLILEKRGKIRDGYNELLDMDMARELARIGLGVDNDTRYFWKIDLHSLADFVGRQRKLHGGEGPVIPYIEKIAEIARAVAPLSWDVLTSDNPIKKDKMRLIMPRDEEIVDGNLSPSNWGPNNTRRVTVGALEELLFVPRDVLDHGQIQPVDYMGDDNSMAQAARTSYGEGTKSLQDNANLVRSLIRDRHTSPTEMAEEALEIKTPVFIAPRQWGRHRTLDNHGFMGYTPVGSQFYFPPKSEFKYQDRKNRQGRGKDMDEEDYVKASGILRESFDSELKLVGKLREEGVDEGIIRQIKGVGFYTKRWTTGDIHNWGHFLGLRLDLSAQKEIRVYAEAVEEFVRAQTPVTAGAFRTYGIDGMRLSTVEIDTLKS